MWLSRIRKNIENKLIDSMTPIWFMGIGFIGGVCSVLFLFPVLIAVSVFIGFIAILGLVHWFYFSDSPTE